MVIENIFCIKYVCIKYKYVFLVNKLCSIVFNINYAKNLKE